MLGIYSTSIISIVFQVMFQVGWLLYHWLMFGWMVMRTHLGQQTQNYQLATSWTVQKHTPWYCLISQPMRWHQWMFTSWARSSWQSSIHKLVQLFGGLRPYKILKRSPKRNQDPVLWAWFFFSALRCVWRKCRGNLFWFELAREFESSGVHSYHFVSTRSKNLKGVFEMCW